MGSEQHIVIFTTKDRGSPRGVVISNQGARIGMPARTPPPWRFARSPRRVENDLAALGAIMRARRLPVEDEALARIQNPVLIVVGEKDVLAGDPRELQAKIPGAELVVVPDRDHLTVVGDRRYKDAVVRFLAARSG